jgi:hypothetical protein
VKHYNKTGGTGIFVETPTAGPIEECFTGFTIDDPYTTMPCGGNVSGTDTVGFYHETDGYGVGYFGGTGGVALNVEFTSFWQDGGKHICFDTTSQLRPWEWTAAGYPVNGGTDFPT